MRNGVRTTLSGRLQGPAELRRSRFGKSYLLFSLAVDPGDHGVTARADGRPAEVRVQLYGDQIDALSGQLRQDVRVSLTGWLELQSQAGNTTRGSWLGMAATSCSVLGDQGEAS